jgi:Lysozyme like domain/Ricin-type beta-trefoil lectin domain
MHVTVPHSARLAILGVLSLLLVGGAAATGAGAPAPAAPRLRPASLAPHGAAGPLAPAQALRAAQTCATYAAAAGWANNGQYGGDLVIAVAVCVAESGGQPTVYYCDGTGTVGYYPPVNCPTGSYDRGLWQINSEYHAEVTDACAFRAQCNADAAYRISDEGTDFAPWAVYDSDVYAQYLGAAQNAVTALAAGAMSAAEFGVCAVPAQQAAGTAVTVGRCGRRVAAQQWAVAGGTVRNGALCLAAGAGAQPAVMLSPCSGGAGQAWAPSGAGQLENRGTGRCLGDPGGSRIAGTALVLTRCHQARAKTWWLP